MNHLVASSAKRGPLNGAKPAGRRISASTSELCHWSPFYHHNQSPLPISSSALQHITWLFT